MKTLIKNIVIALCMFTATTLQAQNLIQFKENNKVGFKDQNGKVVIVAELTPPTVLIVVGKVPVPLPVTSPVKVIN